MTFLDFEQPIRELTEQIQALKDASATDATATDGIPQLEKQLKEKKQEIYNNLSVWQRIQVSRHPR